MSDERILLAHGGGGERTKQLLDEHIVPKLNNDLLAPLDDAAMLPTTTGRLCMTTDTFVVTPLEFPGGNIGHLAVCGTVNDLAMAGAIPIALSLGMVLEEGLELAVLDRMVDALAATAKEAGVRIATGDTKVIERRSQAEPGMILNTAGIGEIRAEANLDTGRIVPGDAILINGPIAEHGLAVMSAREDLHFRTQLQSDAAPLVDVVQALFDAGVDVKFLRDPTRGGVAGLLADLAEQINRTLEIDEAAIPITPVAQHTADLLGLDPLSVANEGKVVAVVAAADVERALTAWRDLARAPQPVCIGHVTETTPALVELRTRAGGRRVVTRPYGEELPRIC